MSSFCSAKNIRILYIESANIRILYIESANMLKLFAEKNVSSFYSAENIRILYIKSAKTVNEITLNELVKLTTLSTTGPRFFLLHCSWCHVAAIVRIPVLHQTADYKCR